MSLPNFLKNQMLLARHVRKGEHEPAIKILEDSLTGTSGDITTLEIIALAYHLSGEDNKGIETANKALAYDSTSFGALKILSEIYANQDNHEMAIQYVKRGIQYFKDDKVPLSLKIFGEIVKRLAKVTSRFEKVAQRAKQNLEGNREWLAWAHSYVAWYEDNSRRGESGSL